jgi:DNA invertase Pin-like site-specific DNA recombinase
LQQHALQTAGCDKIYEDTLSGMKQERQGLNLALEVLRSGDVLVIWKLDRLGRSVKQLINLVGDLEKKGIQFKSLTEGIDTSTAAGRFFFHVMASLAQMEREMLIERTKAGLDAAKKKGRQSGRKRKMTNSKLESAKKLLTGGSSHKEIAKDLGLSIPTLYRWLPASEITSTP